MFERLPVVTPPVNTYRSTPAFAIGGDTKRMLIECPLCGCKEGEVHDDIDRFGDCINVQPLYMRLSFPRWFGR